ncbi:MAG: hypothetical protein V3T77_08805 [Planctomycetota bacterium]
MNRLPLVLLPLLLAACALHEWKFSDTLVEGRRMLVEVEQWHSKDASTFPEYAHPRKLDPQFVESSLTSLQYRMRRMAVDQVVRSVVVPEMAKPLAAAIVEGLEKCQSDERIRFIVRNPTDYALMLRVERLARGVAFVKPEGTFNVAFDLVGIASGWSGRVRTQRDSEDYDPEDWEDPTASAEGSIELIIPDHARFQKTAKGEHHPLWIRYPIP